MLQQVQIEHAYQDGIYVRQMIFPSKGSIYCGHYHYYDHVTLVARGKVGVKFCYVEEAGLPEELKEFTGPTMFITRAYRQHELTALEDNTCVCCIHAIRNPDGSLLIPGDEHTREKVSEMLRNRELHPLAEVTLSSEIKTKIIEKAKKEDTLIPESYLKLI